MHLAIRAFTLTLAVGLVPVAWPSISAAQQAGRPQSLAGELPDAPQPQIELAAGDPAPAHSAEDQSVQQSSAVSAPASQVSSSAQSPADQSAAKKSERERAEEQLKEQEHQRVAGVMATFNTTSNRNALPLSPSQKFQLFFRSEIDPWPFLLSGLVAGIGQADDSYPEWGQGMQGYAKRFGGAYSDAFIGNFFGNAVLPILLREDPRYFQKGTGSKTSRFLWAASSTVWCKRDRGGWGPNYANVGGNLIGAAIARAYYPPSERDVASTISDGLTVSAEGIVGSEVIEFWPDIARYLKRKHEQKLARKAAAAKTQAN